MAERPNWTDVQTTLNTWFASALGGKRGYNGAGGTTVPVYWEREDADCPVGNDYYGQLHIDSVVGVGVDETRYEEISGASAPRDIQPTVCGQREFTLECVVIARSQSLPVSPMRYLERARTALKWRSAFAAFDAAGIAFLRAEPMLELPEDAGQRDQSRVQMDVIFSTAAELADAPITWIEKVKYSGAIDSTFDGSPDVVIPETEVSA